MSTAATVYEATRENLDLLLADIEEGLDAHRPTDPELIHWGHVGDLTHFAEQLTEIADQLHCRGEYRKEKP